jgi:hypothetical protein
MNSRKLLLLPLLLALATAAVAQDSPIAKTGALLEKALQDPAATVRQADGTYAVWVYFSDRGLAVDALNAAVAGAASALPPRTLARRAKMKPAGAALADAADLPVAAAYLAAVQATGAAPRRQSRWLNAASFNATAAQIRDIAGLPFVRKLELVAKFRRPEPEVAAEELAQSLAARDAARAGKASVWTLEYGGSLPDAEQINVPAVHDLGIHGQGVIIGMLDTGFKTTHVALSDIDVLARYDFVNDDDVVENEPGDPSSQHNHGTITLSAIMGYEPGELIGPAFGASVILAKTEDVSQEVPIEEDNWVAGLEWIESLGADVVSSSLGYYDWYEFADLDGNTAVTTIAADLAVGRGLVVVNSAGNSRNGFGHIIAPADGDSVIAVGAVSLSGEYASFSSPGPTYDGRIKPDVMALGVGNHVVSVQSDTEYGTASGTSLSCPLAAGVAALVLSRVPSLNPLQVREAMRETADRAQAPDNDYGWGILDALAAVTYWGASIVHTPLPDTDDPIGPYTVAADITGRVPLDPARIFVVWRAGGGPWQNAPLAAAGGDTWQALLPGQPGGTTVSYYLEVTDTAEITMRLPAAGADAPFAFYVDSDVAVPPPAVTRLVGNVPNPFNPQTTIVFDLARGGPVRLDIVDLRGRRVRRLLRQDLIPGRHYATWDGRDDDHRETASGVYLVRLTVGATGHLRKLTLVR